MPIVASIFDPNGRDRLTRKRRDGMFPKGVSRMI